MPDILVVAAHPDDETIGLASRLGSMHPLVLHVTDGAPGDPRELESHGFARAEDYARVRRQELLEALALAGIGPDCALSFDIPDQQASYNLAAIARRLRDLLPGFAKVYAPSYDGGHPDHDAVCFAVHAACRLLPRPPRLYEYALYHGRAGAFVPLEFPPFDGCPVETITLTPAQRDLKRRMVACFRTQVETLAPFPLEFERRRPAPAYDFTAPPNSDCVYYDRFPWGISSAAWRSNAAAAPDELGLRGAI